MSKKSKALKKKPLEIKVFILKNKDTGEVVRLLPMTYVAQSWRYKEDKWKLLRTEKLDTDLFKWNVKGGEKVVLEEGKDEKEDFDEDEDFENEE